MCQVDVVLLQLGCFFCQAALGFYPSQVSAVLVTPEGDIVSASLDKTIRIWRGGECAAVLEGHEAAVLCLLRLPNGDLLSGSGDCIIRVWSGGKCTHTIAAHSDSVRCHQRYSSAVLALTLLVDGFPR
jgi:phospholipase A-2-activating protein